MQVAKQVASPGRIHSGQSSGCTAYSCARLQAGSAARASNPNPFNSARLVGEKSCMPPILPLIFRADKTNPCNYNMAVLAKDEQFCYDNPR